MAVTQLPAGDVIVATRKGSSVDLSRWAIAGNGTPTLLESDVKAGPGVVMALQSVSDDTFLTAMADPEGDLVVKSWRLELGGGIEHLDTYRDETRTYIQVAAAGPLNTDVYNGHRATTAAATSDGFLAHHVWAVELRNRGDQQARRAGRVHGHLQRQGGALTAAGRDGVRGRALPAGVLRLGVLERGRLLVDPLLPDRRRAALP